MGILSCFTVMDGLHLPQIVRERSGRFLGSVSEDITQYERLALAGRRRTNTTEKRRATGENKSTRKKRTNNDNREHTTSLNKASNTTKSAQSKTPNTRKRFDNIGLPKITTNNEENTIKSSQASAVKKARKTKSKKGDTISYVYSKSLQDENTMAFLRNSDFERDFNINSRNTRSNCDNKKPYGLPALKPSEGIHEKEGALLGKELDFSDGSETESILNAWEAIDDEASSGSVSEYNSTDCSTGNYD